MTTSIKRPILLPVKSSLQDDHCRSSTLKRNKTIGEFRPGEDGSQLRQRDCSVGSARSAKTKSLVSSPTSITTIPNTTCINGNQSRASLPSSYDEDLATFNGCCSTGSPTTSDYSLSSSSRNTTNSSSTDSIDSPSLILPHLYLGDQAQTQMDTLSSLNISYVLSLQSLPKFLDKQAGEQASQSPQAATSNAKVKSPDACFTDDVQMSECDLLPSVNSSKDYLVKIDPNSDSDCQPIVSELPGKSSQSSGLLSDELADSDCDDYDAGEGCLMDQDQNNQSNQSTSSHNDPANNCQVTKLGRCLKKRCDKLSSSMHKLIRGKCINISDTFEQIVDKFFDETHSFIEEARRNRCNVLVHCKAGISRSPTIAIAYLMKWKRLHLQDAYNFVKRCRPQISPNLNFMGQLVSYERQLQMCAESQLACRSTCCLLNRSIELAPKPPTMIDGEDQQRNKHQQQQR